MISFLIKLYSLAFLSTNPSKIIRLENKAHHMIFLKHIKFSWEKRSLDFITDYFLCLYFVLYEKSFLETQNAARNLHSNMISLFSNAQWGAYWHSMKIINFFRRSHIFIFKKKLAKYASLERRLKNSLMKVYFIHRIIT